jgi:hypothetical protein
MGRPPRVPPSLAIAPFRGSAAIRAGLLTGRQLDGASWLRLFPDVHIHQSVPLDHRMWCEAAALLLPKGAAIASRSAALLWGLKGLGEPDHVTVVVPVDHRVRRHPRLEVRRGPLPPEDVTDLLGLPVTVPERTAFDVARLLPRVEAAIRLDALLHQHKVNLPRLTAYFAAHPGWPGCSQADDVLASAEPLAESPMETRLRLLAVDAGLPRPIAQYKIMNGKRFVARVDYAYPEYKVAIEYDGDHHRDRTTFRFDWSARTSCMSWIKDRAEDRADQSGQAAGSTNSTRTPPASFGCTKLIRDPAVPRRGSS